MLRLAPLLAVLLFMGPAHAAHIGDGEFQILINHERGDFLLSEFNYVRELSTPTLDAPAGWVDGDRRGYRCAYTFLTYRGWIVGRATYAYIVTPDGRHPQLVDRGMHENELKYDGTLAESESDPMPGSCHEFVEPANHGEPGAHWQEVTFQHGPHALEVRDFVDGSDIRRVHPDMDFALGDVSEDRVEVIGLEAGGPVLQILYELMQPGFVIPGTEFAVTLHVGCGLECEPHEPEQSPPPSPSPEPSPTPDPGPDPSPSPILGDLNGDGLVNFADLVILVENWTG